MFRYFAMFLFLMGSLCGSSQLTAVYTDANQSYREGINYYQQGNFGLAKNSFSKAAKATNSQFNEESDLMTIHASFMHAKAAIRGKFPEGEKEMVDFYLQYRPHPLSLEAAKELGDLKFNQKRYNEALAYYDLIKTEQLPSDLSHELYFRKGYSHFVQKDFALAHHNFKEILGKDSPYYFETYYYMAMIHFFDQEYDKAIEYFFIVENHENYKSKIPYYIAQIYFAEQKYDDLIEYIPAQISNPDVSNLPELRHILGQTYFLLNKFEDALPHLAYYESKSKKMRQEDFYQLAFTQYQLKQYKEAAENFKVLSNLQSDLGQFSNNYLADAYLKIGQKEEARISFKNVMDYQFNLEMEEEATFNYGKLSAELGFDRAAIKALISLPPTARNYAQAQNVLGSLFESSSDYAMVIATIEGMDRKAPNVLKAYQKVILEKGIQLMNDGEKELAIKTLLKAMDTPVDNYYSAIINYHLADLYHQKGNYELSISYLNKYFTLAGLVKSLPASASLTIANYLQGYNYIKVKEYSSALPWLLKAKELMAVEGYDKSSERIRLQMFSDVSNRIGDSYFKVNKYEKANESYAAASEIELSGQDYAFFQRSMIKGLQGSFYEKIVLLESLIKEVPQSSFRDDAYFQIGETHLVLANSRAAELAFENIVKQNRKSKLITRALLKLGLITYNKGDIDKAIQYYEGVFKNNPNKTEAQEALLALEEIYIKDLGKADDYVALVKKSTGYEMSSFEKDSLSYVAAQNRFENGEYIAAIESYTRYIKQFPQGINRLKALYNRAESKTILKQYADALPDYDLVIAEGPSEFYEDAVYKAALITYNDLKRFEEAFNYFTLLSEITQDDVLEYEALMGALRSAYRFGDERAVLPMAAKVISHQSVTNEDKSLAYFFSGKLNYKGKSWDAAIANLEMVPKMVSNENAAESKYLINSALFQKGEVQTAEERTLETVSNSTSYPYWVAKNLILYGEIMLDRVDLFNARAALEAVIENFTESEELQKEAKERLELVKAKELEMNRLETKTETITLDTIKGNE